MIPALRLGVIGFAAYTLDETVRDAFPPKKQSPLPPLAGHKFIGYMGCPVTSAPKIAARERNLFYSDSIRIAQIYAHSRTSRGDIPVVLQLEIDEREELTNDKLWRDPQLQRRIFSPIPPSAVSYWPAITPEGQRKLQLIIRLHHVVTDDVDESRGHWNRAFNYYFKNES